MLGFISEFLRVSLCQGQQWQKAKLDRREGIPPHKADSTGCGCQVKGQELVTVVLLAEAVSEENLGLKAAGNRIHFPVSKSVLLNYTQEKTSLNTENPLKSMFSFSIPIILK